MRKIEWVPMHDQQSGATPVAAASSSFFLSFLLSLALSLSFSFSALFELSSNVQPRQQGKSGTLQGSFALDRVRNPLPHQPRFSCPSCVGQNARSSAQCFWHIQVPSSFEHVLLVLLRCGHTFGTQARPPPPNVMAGVDLVRRFNSASVILPKRHSEPFNFSRTALPLRSGILAQQRLQLKLVARMSHLCPGCSSGMSSGSCTISAITCFNVLETVPGHCGLLAADLPMSAAGLDVFATVLTKNSVSMVEPFAPQICGTTCRKKSGCAFNFFMSHSGFSKSKEVTQRLGCSSLRPNCGKGSTPCVRG